MQYGEQRDRSEEDDDEQNEKYKNGGAGIQPPVRRIFYAGNAETRDLRKIRAGEKRPDALEPEKDERFLVLDPEPRAAYEDLVDCKVQASQISPMVEYCLKNDLLEPISELTEKANDLSVKIRNIIQKKTSLT